MSDDLNRDDANPRGIRRPSRDELLRARRLRTLTAILDDEDSPFRNRLLDLADMHIETEVADRRRMDVYETATGRVHMSTVDRVDLPGSPPPRPRKERS